MTHEARNVKQKVTHSDLAKVQPLPLLREITATDCLESASNEEYTYPGSTDEAYHRPSSEASPETQSILGPLWFPVPSDVSSWPY